MTKSLRYRLLGLAAMLVCLTALLVPAASQTTTSCCQSCLDRFFQCDGTTIVCCKLYDSCVQQCAGGCPVCPDAE